MSAHLLHVLASALFVRLGKGVRGAWSRGEACHDRSDMYVCRKMNTVRLGLDTNAVWVDAGQMMTTRTSDTQTQNRLTRHTARISSSQQPLSAVDPEPTAEP